MKKKIVIVQNISFYAWHMRIDLARFLSDHNYEVFFVSSSDKYIATKEKTSFTDDEYSKKIKNEFSYYNVNISRKGTNPFTDIKTIYEFYKIYKLIQPDAILHYTAKPNIYGTIAANFLNISVINNIAGLGTLFIKQNFMTKVIKTLYKFSQKKASIIFFQNPDDLNMFTTENLVNPEKCRLLPGSGVNLEKFHPVNNNLSKNNFSFLLIARLLKDKGILEYIEAANIVKAKYKNIEFKILGAIDEGNKTSISQKTVNNWVEKKSIIYLGVTDNVQNVIADADCIVLPSYREGTPKSLLEAAAMEKPIIATNVPGCKEVIDDGINGYLCEVKNAKDLALKIEKMINLSKEERAKMGKKGRAKMINEFDELIVFKKYLKNINELIK